MARIPVIGVTLNLDDKIIALLATVRSDERSRLAREVILLDTFHRNGQEAVLLADVLDLLRIDPDGE